MRVLLLVPKGNGPGNGRRWNRVWPEELEKAIEANHWKLVTPGVLVLAALADPSRYEVDLVDEEFGAIDPGIQYDIAAMYTVTPNARRAYALAEHFRSQGVHIVMGGVHASVCPDEAALYADTLLLGECEYIWPAFLKDYEEHRAGMRYHQAVGTVNLDDSPAPRFELLPPDGKRLIPLQTARGCPHGCSFCNLKSLYGSGYRPKKIERVDRELAAALEINPRATVYFTDDNLFCHRQHSRQLMEMLGAYRVVWYANSDVSFGRDERFIQMAYQAGCRQVLIGFESLNPANLEGIDEDHFKSRNVADYGAMIERIQSNGIGVVGSFIVGLEDDDQRTFDDLERFIRTTHLYGANITVSTPYPGTKLFDRMDQAGRMLTSNWDEYTIFQPVATCRKIDIGELNERYMALLADIYSAPNVTRRKEYFKQVILDIMKGGRYHA